MSCARSRTAASSSPTARATRLAGEAPPITVDTPAWQARMLDTFGVAAEAGALRFPEDADAVLALLEAGARAGRWAGVLRLARGADAAATAGGRVGAWGRLVDHALAAGRALGDPAATAWALHQQGSRALCLGDRVLAADALDKRSSCANSSATRRAPPRPVTTSRSSAVAPPAFAERRAQAAASPLAVVRGRGRCARRRGGRGGALPAEDRTRAAPAADSTVAPDSGNGPGGAQGSTNNAGATDPNAGSGGGAPGSGTPGGGDRRCPARRASRPRRYHSAAAARADQRRPDHQRLEHLVRTARHRRSLDRRRQRGRFRHRRGRVRESHLPANVQCAVAVTLTPAAIGQRTATVDFADVGNGSPAQVVLTGTGCRGETCSGTSRTPVGRNDNQSPTVRGRHHPDEATAVPSRPTAPTPRTHRRASANGGQEWVTQSSPATTSAPISVARPCPAPSGSARGSTSARRSGACPPRSPRSSLPTSAGLRRRPRPGPGAGSRGQARRRPGAHRRARGGARHRQARSGDGRLRQGLVRPQCAGDRRSGRLAGRPPGGGQARRGGRRALADQFAKLLGDEG